MSLERITFPQPFQKGTVEANDKGRIWYMPLSGKFVAFISKRGMDWTPNTYLEFIIDGKLWEKVEYEIDVDIPETFNPPIVAKRFIEVWAFNNDSSSHTFGVLLNGELCRPK